MIELRFPSHSESMEARIKREYFILRSPSGLAVYYTVFNTLTNLTVGIPFFRGNTHPQVITNYNQSILLTQNAEVGFQKLGARWDAISANVPNGQIEHSSWADSLIMDIKGERQINPKNLVKKLTEEGWTLTHNTSP